MENIQLEHSDIVLRAHNVDACFGEVCTLHKRTDHHMRLWPQHWRQDRYMMERICSHGIGHPDPDDPKLLKSQYERIHGCDGCCTQ